jgi:hypothetical protein
MENQHRKISGYRELSQTEIDLMNQIKSIGEVLEGTIARVWEHIDTQYASRDEAEQARLDKADPMRWIIKATDDLQVGLMELTRAVAQPTKF